MKVEIGPYPEGEDDRKISVKIHDYDTWSMYETLGHIVLPMLHILQVDKQGSPYVDLEDVPEKHQLHGTSRNESRQHDMFADDDYDEACWLAHHDRWHWVLGEMIFAFESICGVNQNWEDKYWSGESDIWNVPQDKDGNALGPAQKWDAETPPELKDKVEFWQMVHGPNHTAKWDIEGHNQEAARIQNGFRLFGKYYQALWD